MFRTRVLLVLAVFLALSGCTGEDGDRQEILEGYGVKVVEQEIVGALQGNSLDLTFTLHRTAGRTLAGTLKVELIRLASGQVEGSGSAAFSLDKSSGPVKVQLAAPKAQSTAELGGYVLRYFVELPEGTLYGLRSLFMVVARSGLSVIGNNRFAVGEPGVLRVLVTNVNSGQGVKDAPVTVEYSSDSSGNRRTLAQGKTDLLGEFEARFTFAAAEKGGGFIHVSAGKLSSKHSVIVEQERQVLLTTDKPLYQPSQTVNIRALAMKQPGVKPVAAEPLLLELEDPAGNKMLKKQVDTDAYGIAFHAYKLARLAPLGTYRLRVTMGTTVRQKTFRVEHYTLPKFKVTVSTDKAYYRPGATVSGKVQADYFFGKHVSGGKVVLQAMADVGGKPVAEVQGKTDSSGAFSFSFTAPYSKSLVLVAQVSDTSGAMAQGTAGVKLTNDTAVLQVVAEREQVISGQPLEFYVMLADPAGRPISGEVTVTGLLSDTVKVPKSGLAVYRAVPDCFVSSSFTATFIYGNYSEQVSIQCDNQGSALHLYTDKAMYREGESATFTLFAPKAATSAKIELVQHNATVKTVAAPLKNGKATVKLPLDSSLRRTLEVRAHCLLGKKVLAAQKLIYVQGADQLKVKVTTDQQKYRPADKAKVTLQLTDYNGKPTPGAMGVQVVDEALYALTEFKAGLERRFFFLEQEVIDAGKKLQFVSPNVLLSETPTADDQARARMLFAAAGEQATYPIQYHSADQDLGAAARNSKAGMRAFAEDLEQQFRDKWEDEGEVPEKKNDDAMTWLEARISGRIDSFGVPYQYSLSEGYFQLQSAGMDERWSTADDLDHAFSWRIRYDGDIALPGYPHYDSGYAGYPDAGGWYADAAASADAGYYPSPDAGAPSADAGTGPKPDAGGSTTPLRQYFPETLYVNPALITDSTGKAQIDLRLADSITTWRLTSIAHTSAGQLGSTEAAITVFQEFFVDSLLPKHLVQNDEVTVPVAVYNYTTTPQTVTVTVTPESWFTLLGSASQQVTVGPRSVLSAHFPIRVDKVGAFGFTATGKSATDSDALQRTVEVLPDGERHEVVFSGALQPGKVSHTVTIPQNAIAGASDLFVKVYPGLLAETMEGLESMFKRPYGCFEQTSSATYPNVLVLQYLKKAGKSSPALESKAKAYIDQGYQRLVGFEVSGGGFSLYGQPPAKTMLSAFGLVEFSDMAKVRYVDPQIISRTQNWLISQQQGSGEFSAPHFSCYNYGFDAQTLGVMNTAYVAWALHQSGYQGGALSQALSYLRTNVGQVDHTYAQALAANALLSISPGDSDGQALLTKLKQKAQVSGQKAHWTSKGCSIFYGSGQSLTTETTALVAGALMLVKDSSQLTRQALNYLTGAKGSYGGWGTTSATVQALRTLLISLESRGGNSAAGTIAVSHNGALFGSVNVTPATSDVTRLFDLKQEVVTGQNAVSIDFTGTGELAYQVVGVYYTPVGSTTPAGPLDFSVSYDTTSLKVNETLTATATVQSKDPGTIPNVMVRLGLPPGFTVELSDLSPTKTGNVVQNAELDGPYLVLYLGGVSTAQSVQVPMKATLAVKGKAPPSVAYPYYTPEFYRVVQTPVVTVTQ